MCITFDFPLLFSEVNVAGMHYTVVDCIAQWTPDHEKLWKHPFYGGWLGLQPQIELANVPRFGNSIGFIYIYLFYVYTYSVMVIQISTSHNYIFLIDMINYTVSALTIKCDLNWV
jgi:hypothetical protein